MNNIITSSKISVIDKKIDNINQYLINNELIFINLNNKIINIEKNITNLDNKITNIEKNINNLDNKINLLINTINKDVKENCEKMSSHIDFIENVYENVKAPMDYICDKFNNLSRITY